MVEGCQGVISTLLVNSEFEGAFYHQINLVLLRINIHSLQFFKNNGDRPKSKPSQGVHIFFYSHLICFHWIKKKISHSKLQ